jgi:iron complex transport system substrate-binding protein
MDNPTNKRGGYNMNKVSILVTLLLVLFMSSFQALISSSQDFPVTIVDDVGRTVTIQNSPQRIVSLAPSNTEILFALGLDDRVVGITSYCDYPPKVKDLISEGKVRLLWLVVMLTRTLNLSSG